MDHPFTKFGHPRHWWRCLPAVPSGREALDHWVAAPDGRASVYQRLRRVWMDSTRFQSPASDPERPHEFSNFNHTVSRTVGMWELLGLIGPADWYPAFESLASLQSDDFRPLDAAWAYEFEDATGSGSRCKQTDVVAHLRDQRGLERLIVVEVKRPGDKLKEACERPDTSPASYLDLPSFKSIADRRLVYLVDASYADVVRAKVDRGDQRWGIVTWQSFRSLQHRLAQLLPHPFSDLFSMCVDALAFDRVDALRPRVDEAMLAQLRRQVTLSEGAPRHLCDLAAGAIDFLRVRHGLPPGGPPFPYLAEEPSFATIHGYGEHERQRMRDRRVPYWKLPDARSARLGPDVGEAASTTSFEPGKNMSDSLGMPRRTILDVPSASPVRSDVTPGGRVVTSFPNPVPLASVIGIPLATKVEPLLGRAMQSNGPLGGLTIGKKGGTRSLCYVGRLPTEVDATVRELLRPHGFQVSAVRDASKLEVFNTHVGSGQYVLRVTTEHSARVAESQATPGPAPTHRDASLTPEMEVAFRTLGVIPTAAPAVIRAAYHALAREHHPDQQRDRDPRVLSRADAEFRKLATAYERIMAHLRGR